MSLNKLKNKVYNLICTNEITAMAFILICCAIVVITYYKFK